MARIQSVSNLGDIARKDIFLISDCFVFADIYIAATTS